MKRQRNMAQMKEQIKIPEKELNKMEIHNLSDAGFKTLVIRMLKELSEDVSNIKKIELEHIDDCQMGAESGRMSEEVRGLRSTNW